jgi:hypothetical protein
VNVLAEGGKIWYWDEGWLLSPTGQKLFTCSLAEGVELATQDGGVVRRGQPPTYRYDAQVVGTRLVGHAFVAVAP